MNSILQSAAPPRSRTRHSPAHASWRKALAGVLAPLLVVLGFSGCRGAAPQDAEDVDLHALRFVGQATCATCHVAEAEAWHGSDHDRAMEVASPASVQGNFNNVSLTTCGVTTRFYRRNGTYLVHTVGPDGRYGDFEITHTFGVRPLQQYLVSFPDGRKQALTVAWDVEQERWFSLYGEECVAPGDWLHWTGGAMNWNYMCASCHSTALQRGFQPAEATYQTTFAEIDVSCEACHGPGERHVAWAEGAGEATSTENRFGLTVDLSLRSPARLEVETCAPCHSRRQEVYPDFVPGTRYLDHYDPALLDDGLYFADGQIEDEVFVYGSFSQSKMFAAGVRCTTCHDAHALTTRQEGNALCTQCHVPELYDVPDHLRHDPGTEGALCIDCHMPPRTYMVVDPRRDHRFGVPRPDLTIDLGVPNACNQCHSAQPPAWAHRLVEEWYGPERSDSASFAHAFAGGRRRDSAAEAPLKRIAEDAARPPIVRATALRLLQAYDSPDAAEMARRALADPEPLVRVTAVRHLETHGLDDMQTAALRALTSDEYRVVRMEAARVLLQADGGASPIASADSAFWQALAEYQEGQYALSDQPAAHLNLAVVHERLGELGDAQAAYQMALRLDSSFIPAHINLAMLADRQRLEALESGDRAKADSLFRSSESALRGAIRLDPELGEAHYALGLLLAEIEGRLHEAAEHLRRAAALDTTNARILYNAGLAHQRLEDPARAELYLRSAHERDPQNPDFLNALGIFYLQQEQWDLAESATLRLQRAFPQNTEIQRRLAYIAERRRAEN